MKKAIENLVVGLLTVILVAQVLSILPIGVKAQGEEFQASYSTGVPVIDGMLGQEWNDANSYAINLSGVSWITPGPWDPPWVLATVYFKHDGTNIYLGLKVLAGDHDFDEFAVYFDEGNDGGYGSGTGDGVLTTNQEDVKCCFSPSISGYTIEDGCYKSGGWYAYSGGDFVASCAFVDAHWECEFSIPFVGIDGRVDDVSDLVCGITDTVGIKIQYFTQPGALNYFYPADWQDQIGTYTTLGFAPAVSGITVNNVVEGTPPSSDWNYKIEYYIGETETPSSIDFVLPAGGGSASFPDLSGAVVSITETSKFGYYTDIAIEIHGGHSYEIPSEDPAQASVYIYPGEFIVVTFTNTAMPAFAVKSVGSTPPSDLNFQIPALTPIPVQAGWSVDINPPSGIDLVRGKPTAILVNVSNTYRIIGASEQVTVTVQFEGNTYTNVTTGSQIAADSIISIWNKAITPPSTAGTNKQITGTYKIGTDTPTGLTSTNFAVKSVPDLSLYYAPLSKSAYGSESELAYNLMVGNSAAFVNATYPVKNVTINARYSSNGISGTNNMLKDATNIAKAAKLAFPNSNVVGIGIGPSNTGKPDYFAFQGYPGAAGVSFGPSVKGVIALDGYYTAAAHEVAHTYGLYWGVPEQYQEYPLNGKTASGVWADKGQWRTGYSFMGTAPYKTLDFSWVDSDTTYKTLFSSMATNPADPEILVVNGLIYKNGTVELAPWYHLQQGTPDTLTSGDYALKFVASDGSTLNIISFDASFFMQIDPGISVGENAIDVGAFGRVDTDVAGFAFATVYPQGTAAVQVVNMVTSEVLATVNAADIVFMPQKLDFSWTGPATVKKGSTATYTANYKITANAALTNVKVQGGLGTKAKNINIYFDGKLVGTLSSLTAKTWTVYNNGEPLPAGVALKLDVSKNNNVFTLTISSMATGDTHTLSITFDWYFGSSGTQSITGAWSAVCISSYGTLKTPYTNVITAVAT